MLKLVLVSALAHAELPSAEQSRISALSEGDAIAAYEAAVPSHIESSMDQAVAFRLLGFQWESVNDIDSGACRLQCSAH